MNEENFQKRMGKKLAVLSWIILLILLTIYFYQYLEQQSNPNQNLALIKTDNFKEIRLQRNRYGHYVANGMINQQPVVFLLDTGATDIGIPGKVAQHLDLKTGTKIPVYTANGQIDVYTTMLDHVSLGGIELQNIRGNINPFMDGDKILLGMSFLKHLSFSQQGDQLLIRQY